MLETVKVSMRNYYQTFSFPFYNEVLQKILKLYCLFLFSSICMIMFLKANENICTDAFHNGDPYLYVKLNVSR